MSNIVDFPGGHSDESEPDEDGPFLEAINHGHEWVLYWVPGYNGRYRKLATFEDKEAMDVLFGYLGADS